MGTLFSVCWWCQISWACDLEFPKSREPPCHQSPLLLRENFYIVVYICYSTHCTVSILDFNPNTWREILGDGCSLAVGSCSHVEQCVLPLTWYERRDVQCGCIFPPGLLLLWLNIQSGLCILPLSRLLFEVTVLNELVWKVIWFQVGKGVTQISLEPQLGISNHIWC